MNANPHKYRSLRLSTVFLMTIALITGPAYLLGLAQANTNDGDLDPGFGNGGKERTDFPGATDEAKKAHVQPDGRLIVMGSSNSRIAIVRFNSDGSLDTSFGNVGEIMTSFPQTITLIDFAIQSDAKILAASISAAGLILTRYNPNGSIDSSFGSGGSVTTQFSGSPQAITTQADGKVVAVGYRNTASSTRFDFALARYNADGSLDTSFDNDGIVTTNIAGSNDDLARHAAIQTDGKIVTVGITTYIANGAHNDLALVRYNADGSLDTSFGNGGIVTTDISNNDSSDGGVRILLQADGKILAAGHSYFSSLTNYDFALVRYDLDGSIDTSFGSAGKTLADFSGMDGYDFLRDAALQADGKIVTVGYSHNNVSGTYTSFAVARFDADGNPDTGFDGDGKLIAKFFVNDNDFAESVALQIDGRIVVAGKATNLPTGTASDFGIVRYNQDGSLDAGFDGDGRLLKDFVGGSDEGHDLAIQPDGKMVMVGSNNGNFAVSRHNSDGTPDAGFGNGGKVSTVLPYSAFAKSVALQPDGKILLGGYARSAPDREDFALVRYNPDGSIDAGFGVGGIVLTDVSGSDVSDVIEDIAIQPDGKVVAVGDSGIRPSHHPPFPAPYLDIAVVRYNPNGSLDVDFDGDGIVTADSGSFDLASSVAIQPDARIVIAGTYSSDGGFALLRYNQDGSPDYNFGDNGVAIASLDFGTGGTGVLADIAFQQDGKIVAVGSTGSDTAIARFNSDGSLDTDFDGDGTATANLTTAAGWSVAQSVGIQPDGKIVSAGYLLHNSSVSTAYDSVLLRYIPDGSLDATFGVGGVLVTDLSGNNNADRVSAVAVQPDARIVIGGSVYNTESQSYDFLLARFGGINVLSVTLSPSSVTGAKNSTGTVTLDSPAPPTGAKVLLSSSNTAVATVPASTKVSAGATTKTFTVTTKAVATPTNVTISASYQGDTKTVTLTIIPPVLTGVTLTPASITGPCQISTGKVTINGKAPAGGVPINLANGNAAAIMPLSVTVPEGLTSTTFTVTASQVSAKTTGTVTATPADPNFGGTSYSKTLNVLPIGVKTLVLSPNPAPEQTTVLGSVTLTCSVPSGVSVSVMLSTTNKNVAQPTAGGAPLTNFTITSGDTGTFDVTTKDVSTQSFATIKATANSISKSVVLTVSPQ